MRILIIGNTFFGYTERVADVMRKKHDVEILLVYRHSKMDRIMRKMKLPVYNESKFYSNAYKKIENNRYDRVFVFGGGVPFLFLRKIRNVFDTTKFILYMSADLSSYKFTNDYLSMFDKCLTYSISDSLLYGFKYQPWFYSESKQTEKVFDICFIGSIHDSRLAFIQSILNDKSVIFYCYIYTDIITYLKKFWHWRKMSKYIHFRSLNYHNYIEILASSKAVLDIPLSTQKNITTRPIEALATKTKVITTSHSIEYYDFYNKDNILIIESCSNMKFNSFLDKCNLLFIFRVGVIGG